MISAVFEAFKARLARFTWPLSLAGEIPPGVGLLGD